MSETRVSCEVKYVFKHITLSMGDLTGGVGGGGAQKQTPCPHLAPHLHPIFFQTTYLVIVLTTSPENSP